MPMATVTRVLQFAFLVVPPIVLVLTRRICIALRDRPGPANSERRVPIERSADGGYGVASEDSENAISEESHS